MATNNFKPFATAANANVTTQVDWEALPALLTGFSSGKASSAQVNKAIRQASFIAAALAQYTANKSGLDVLDDGDLAGFITKMSTAFGKDFQALDATLSALAGLATGANKLPYFTGTDTASQTDLTSVGRDIIGKNAIADVLTYLGLDTALAGKQPIDATLTTLSGKDVYELMNYLNIGKAGVLSLNGYIPLAPVMVGGVVRIPILQWLRVDTNSAGTVIANLPVPYPNQLLFGVACERQPTGWGTGVATSWGFDSVNSNAVQISAYVRNIQAGSVLGATASGTVITLGY